MAYKQVYEYLGRAKRSITRGACIGLAELLVSGCATTSRKNIRVEDLNPKNIEEVLNYSIPIKQALAESIELNSLSERKKKLIEDYKALETREEKEKFVNDSFTYYYNTKERIKNAFGFDH